MSFLHNGVIINELLYPYFLSYIKNRDKIFSYLFNKKHINFGGVLVEERIFVYFKISFSKCLRKWISNTNKFIKSRKRYCTLDKIPHRN